ncbi:MAG: hypothetical protein VCC36_10615 [Gammaproteobacteria bacterium]
MLNEMTVRSVLPLSRTRKKQAATETDENADQDQEDENIEHFLRGRSGNKTA